MLNALENFTMKISIQPLAQAALGSIQEFDGKDKVMTMPWLYQVELVMERTDIQQGIKQPSSHLSTQG